MTVKFSPKLNMLIRAVVALLLLAYVFYRIDERQILVMIKQSVPNNASAWLLALAATYAGLHCGIVRWYSLLKAQGFTVSFAEVFRQFFLGQFFNSFMLGACGGDVARAVAVARVLSARQTLAVATVIVDRAIGLFTTVVFGCISVVLRFQLFNRTRTNYMAAMLMLVFLAGGLLGMLMLFARHLFEHWPYFQRLEQRSSIGPWIRRAYDAFFFYRQHRNVLLRAIILSLANLVALTSACYWLGTAFRIPATLEDYLTFFPIITVLSAIPLTPGGLGVRENLFMAMFGSVGTQPERAVLLSLAVYTTGLFWSLFGAVFLVLPGRANAAAGALSEKDQSLLP